MMLKKGTLGVCALSCFVACGPPRERGADLILKNANVITLDDATPRAEAIAFRGDRIAAVGSDEEIERLSGDSTETLDLEGATVVPGLIDAHMHFSTLGWQAKQLYLDETKSPEEAVAIVKEQVEKAAPGEWVTGQGWHTVTWGGGSLPDNVELSRNSPDHPVYLVGMASHVAWVNRKAIEIAGITKDTPDPPGGKIARHPRTGEPTGTFTETAMDLVSKHLPPETRESRKADILSSVELSLSMGLTEVHDAGVGYEEIDIYKEILEEGKLGVRLHVMFGVPDAGEALDEYIETPPRIGLGDERLTLRSLKVFADGALGARGAALLEPYSDAPGESGLVQNDAEELYQLVSKAMNSGYQVAIHAIGDRGNRNALDAIERAQKEFPDLRPRHRIEHAQVVAPEDIPRFAKLGVIASMQPIHAPMDMGFAETRVGPERIQGGYVWKSFIDSGATLVSSADTPAFPVKYTNPLWGIYAAVTRQDNEGNPPEGWHPHQRMSRLDALKSYTVNAAYAAFEEDVKGTLTPGKLADVTVLSRDILEVPAREILTAKVLMTIVGGKIAFTGSPES
ncbi:MAG: amidohydrolase [Vicinamibacteria bacterium]